MSAQRPKVWGPLGAGCLPGSENRAHEADSGFGKVDAHRAAVPGETPHPGFPLCPETVFRGLQGASPCGRGPSSCGAWPSTPTLREARPGAPESLGVGTGPAGSEPHAAQPERHKPPLVTDPRVSRPGCDLGPLCTYAPGLQGGRPTPGQEQGSVGRLASPCPGPAPAPPLGGAYTPERGLHLLLLLPASEEGELCDSAPEKRDLPGVWRGAGFPPLAESRLAAALASFTGWNHRARL